MTTAAELTTALDAALGDVFVRVVPATDVVRTLTRDLRRAYPDAEVEVGISCGVLWARVTLAPPARVEVTLPRVVPS